MSPFLHRCQCTRGFFTLRPCAADAPLVCPHCQRRICAEHWRAGSVPPCCVECAARAEEARSLDDDYDSYWFHSYRHGYYRSHGYRPIYVGTQVDPYYDQYDARGFDPAAGAGAAAAGGGDFDDDGVGGLGDS
ncbi:MAG TPA: hypothetical protein VFH68_15425 [Polyangia bacterium]|jgi:hypothetical protein|nr:hypothetical protein [Polyangia bacterium]